MALTNLQANITLDVYDHDGAKPSIKTIALDDNTRYVLANIRSRGEVYDIGSSATVQLIVIRPDKVGVQIAGQAQGIEIEQEDGSVVTVYGAYAELDQAAIVLPGTLLGQFKITSGDQILRTQIFQILNGEALDSDTWAGDYDGYNLDELVADVAEAVEKVGDLETDVAQIKEDLNDKYSKYVVENVSGLTLDMLDVCPSQYSITTYDGTNAYMHSTLAGSGITNLIARMKKQYADVTFRTYYVTASMKILFASDGTSALGFTLNATTGNVALYTATTNAYKTGILLNSDCRNIVRGDKLNFKIDGTRVALYLIDNDIPVPVWKDEWIDVLATYSNVGFTEDDIAFGLITANSARNEPLIYDFSYKSESGDHFMPFDEVDSRLTALENGAGFNPHKVDLFLFMGQSNMAGRGNGAQAPEVIADAGYEFRAISDPTKLYLITEPFGVDENVSGKIYDYLGGYKAKTGDMIPAFVNAYFENTHVSIVGVSASEGGTRIANWLPDTPRYADAVARYSSALNWLESNGYTIRHKYVLWCQGESNGDDGTTKADYISAFSTMANAWYVNGIEKIFLVKIGNYNGEGTQDYNVIMDAQNEICQTTKNVIMVSTDFAGMKARGLMKDDFHYTQVAYNEVGTYAGVNVALYVNTGKEPTMYDTQDGSLYYTHKN